MSAPIIVEVPLAERAYPVHIGAGLLDRVGELLRERSAAGRATIITDTNVGPIYSELLAAALERSGVGVTVLVVPAGDESKSLGIAAELFGLLAEHRPRREEPILALGGGMIGDLAGFIAATWHRGVPLVQCPTTLEAAVDASVGGKTALNLPAGKNLIGAFHQPLFVAIDTDCLETLSDRDYLAALAESVKHAVLAGEEFFAWHEAHAGRIRSRDPSIAADLIRRNCAFKASVVVADERESGRAGVGRAALNFGHTIGHAIESSCGYSLRHGEAVALGIVAECDIAVRLARMTDTTRQRIERLLAAIGLPSRPIPALDEHSLLDLVRSDKKATGRDVRFALPGEIGSIEWATPGDGEVRGAIEYLRRF